MKLPWSQLTVCVILSTLNPILEAKDTSPVHSLTTARDDETPFPSLIQAEHALYNRMLSFHNITLSSDFNAQQSIPLEDFSLFTADNIALVILNDPTLQAATILINGISVNLRSLNIQLQANIDHITVSGNYSIVNQTSAIYLFALGLSDHGNATIKYSNITISGFAALHLERGGAYLTVHNVHLTYKPQTIILAVSYIDEEGLLRTVEEKEDTSHGSEVEPINKDLAYQLNILMKNQLNKKLQNIPISEIFIDPEVIYKFEQFAQNQTGNLNSLVDQLLNSSREDFPSWQDLPKIERIFRKKIGFITVSSTFEADGGWVSNLKTLQRTGDSSLRRVLEDLEVSAAMEIKDLAFGYEWYKARLLGMGPTGRINGSVKHNSLAFRVRAFYEPQQQQCRLALEELRVQRLSHIKIQITGMGPLNWLASKIVSYVTNRAHGFIAISVQNCFARKIREHFEGFDCGIYFPPFLLTNDSFLP